MRGSRCIALHGAARDLAGRRDGSDSFKRQSSSPEMETLSAPFAKITFSKVARSSFLPDSLFSRFTTDRRNFALVDERLVVAR